VPDGEQMPHHRVGADLVVGFDVHDAAHRAVGVHGHHRRVLRQPRRGVVLEPRGEQDQPVHAPVAQGRDAIRRVGPVAQREDGRRLAGSARALDDAAEHLEEVKVRLFAEKVGDQAYGVRALARQRTRGGIRAVLQAQRGGQHAFARFGRDACRPASTSVQRRRGRHLRDAGRAGDVRQRRRRAAAARLRNDGGNGFRLRGGHGVVRRVRRRRLCRAAAHCSTGPRRWLGGARFPLVVRSPLAFKTAWCSASRLGYCGAMRDYCAVNSSTTLCGASSPKKRRWFRAVCCANDALRGKSADSYAVSAASTSPG